MIWVFKTRNTSHSANYSKCQYAFECLGYVLAIVLFLASITSANAANDRGRKLNAYQFDFKTLEGDSLSLQDFKGKVVFVVNTASQCGFTPQYKELQALWNRFREKEFILLAIPSNDFGNQEPGDESEIKGFCELNYSTNFLMTEKLSVKGDTAHPFYKWIASHKEGAASPKWNFHKIIIDREGRLAAWFDSGTEPQDQRVITTIERWLAEEES